MNGSKSVRFFHSSVTPAPSRIAGSSLPSSRAFVCRSSCCHWKEKKSSDEYCQDGFSNETVNTLRTRRIHRDFRAKGLEIRLEKSMLAGFVKYLPLARIDRTVPRFTVQYSRYAASRDLLRFSWLSSDSMKCKGSPCVQGIEGDTQNRQKRRKPCATFNTQHRTKADLELLK